MSEGTKGARSAREIAPVGHAELVARCARGDRDVLRHLFDAEAARMLAVAERIVRRRDLAEEALQETFLQVWANAGRYDPALGTARAWLYAILRYRALSILRNDQFAKATDAATLEALTTSSDGSEASASERLPTTSRLRQCLEALDGTFRELVLMAYVSGYTHGEIAGRLGRPLGTTQTWVRRGLAQLRECMA